MHPDRAMFGVAPAGHCVTTAFCPPVHTSAAPVVQGRQVEPTRYVPAEQVTGAAGTMHCGAGWAGKAVLGLAWVLVLMMSIAPWQLITIYLQLVALKAIWLQWI